MNVHNMMEDLVTAEVNALYDQVKKANSPWLTCDCKNCRLDTISYVLNRIPPKYVVSGRGVTHSNEIFSNHQLIADISAVAMDGIRIISSTKRPFHTLPREECELQKEENPSFNFPTFSGTIYDGSTFEPISGAKVLLKLNGKPVDMVDMTWTNPTQTFQSTKGSFTFWAKPIPAEKIGESRRFEFELEIEVEGYEKSYHYFEIPIISDGSTKTELNTACSIKIRDVVLFKREIFEEDSQNEEK
ncbi:late competence development ComFB family protein [Treponema sp.]|uniref:late competence development ComFB family protein n=1 Tax=Treponema sp. TaxID=166 RepID=UPI00389034BB